MAAKYLRKGNVIRTFSEDGSHADQVFPSISAAKRESRRLQLNDGKGRLGDGSLSVVDKFPATA